MKGRLQRITLVRLVGAFFCNGRTSPVRMPLDFWLATKTNYALLTTIFKALRL